MPGRHCFFWSQSPTTLTLRIFLPPFLHSSLIFEGRGKFYKNILFRVEWFKVSHSLHIVQCGCLWLPLPWELASLMRVESTDLWVQQCVIRSCFIAMLPWQNNSNRVFPRVHDLSLRYLVSLTIPYVCFMEWASNWIKNCLTPEPLALNQIERRGDSWKSYELILLLLIHSFKSSRLVHHYFKENLAFNLSVNHDKHFILTTWNRRVVYQFRTVPRKEACKIGKAAELLKHLLCWCEN